MPESGFQMADLRHLQTFVTVAELQHLTQAAERLHMSQPAASAHIKALEQELGVELFNRGNSGLALTTAGRELVDAAREVLTKSAMLRSKALEMRGVIDGAFRLGVRAASAHIPLSSVVSAILETHPHIKLELYQLSTRSISGGIQTGDLDAGLMLCRELPKKVCGIELERIVYKIAAPKKWENLINNASPGAIASLPWIGVPSGGSHDEMLRCLLGEESRALNRVVESDHEAVHSALIEAGVGLALMREDHAIEAERKGKIVCWNSATIDSTLRYAYCDYKANEPAVKAVAEIVRRIWKDLG